MCLGYYRANDRVVVALIQAAMVTEVSSGSEPKLLTHDSQVVGYLLQARWQVTAAYPCTFLSGICHICLYCLTSQPSSCGEAHGTAGRAWRQLLCCGFWEVKEGAWTGKISKIRLGPQGPKTGGYMDQEVTGITALQAATKHVALVW